MQLSRGRGETTRRRGTSNLFRRQSAAKQLGFDPEGPALPCAGRRNILRIFSFSSARFVRKPRAPPRERWPLFVKRHQGAGSRLSRGLHPAPFPARQGILKFRRISVVRGGVVHRNTPPSLLYSSRVFRVYAPLSSFQCFHPRRSRVRTAGPVRGTQ